MEINVTTNKLVLINKETVNQGEYKINTCNFTFSEEYNDLIKVAVFTNNQTSYTQSIVDNSCDIPSEVLSKTGLLTIGVYAYESAQENNTEVLIKRYSPTPLNVYIDYGSYVENAETPQPPTPSEYEHYLQLLTEGLAQVQDINVTASKVGKVTTITITDKTGTTTTTEILDGEDGANGINGKDGKDGKDR